MAEEKIGNGDALMNALQDFLREMTEEVIRMSADLDMADPDAEAKARRIGEIRAFLSAAPDRRTTYRRTDP